MVSTVDRAALVALLQAGATTLVEALPAAAYEAEHLPGAVNVPDRLTPGLAAELVPDRASTVIVYCSGPGCGRSRAIAAVFERLGYTDVRVYPGGKVDWLEAGLPMEGDRHSPSGAGVGREHV